MTTIQRRFAITFLLQTLAAAPALAQVPAGGEFRINTYTTDHQSGPRAAIDSSGRFIVTWTSRGQDGGGFGVYAQRYSEDGTPAGNEFLVPTYTTDTQASSTVAYAPAGNSVIVWHSAQTSGFDIHGQRYAADGSPAGGEFVVNTYTVDTQYKPEVAALPSGGFVVAWPSHVNYNVHTIRARRFDGFGIPMGPEFPVNTSAANATHAPIASGRDGRFVIVWEHGGQIAARLYDASGVAVGAQFFVTPVVHSFQPHVAMAGDGAFVVVWEDHNYPSPEGIRGRLFSPVGTPLGEEFQANDDPPGRLLRPAVAANRVGDFVISWSRRLGYSTYEVIARRFSPDGIRRGDEFRVNTFTTGNQSLERVSSDEVGNFVVTWNGESQDGSGFGVFAQRFGGLLPTGLAVDATSSSESDGNGVLEPGESVGVRPSWRNVNGAAQTFDGTIPLFAGPPGARHTITDAAGSYGTVANGATAPCSDCYGVRVSAPSPRPRQHWDAVAQEDIAPDTQGQRKQWRLHVGDSFADVPRAGGFYRFVETLLHDGVTAGCSATQYCPLATTTRAQMAVFVLVAKDGPLNIPPACMTPMFDDVPARSPFCPWIEELARRGVVAGCGGGNFCPDAAVSREQMPLFVLQTKEPGVTPPACATPMFNDVPASSPFCRWIEELARRGVVTGCGGGNYCPAAPVTREQMAVFISATFGLQLYGP